MTILPCSWIYSVNWKHGNSPFLIQEGHDNIWDDSIRKKPC